VITTNFAIDPSRAIRRTARLLSVFSPHRDAVACVQLARGSGLGREVACLYLDADELQRLLDGLTEIRDRAKKGG